MVENKTFEENEDYDEDGSQLLDKEREEDEDDGEVKSEFDAYFEEDDEEYSY